MNRDLVQIIVLDKKGGLIDAVLYECGNTKNCEGEIMGHDLCQ